MEIAPTYAERVDITKYIKHDGLWRFAPVAKRASGSVHWDHVLVNGASAHHPEGKYFIEWREDGARRRRSVGTIPSEILAEAQRQRALLDAKTMPYILGGDHAITMATIAAYSNEKPVHIVHLDAHFDFIDERNGITWGHGSPMRRASEMAHVKGITTLGPHNMASVSKRDYEAAKAYGTHVVPLRKFRAIGAKAALAHIPDGERVYVSIDIDSFDPSIAPGTATISHGGFTYYEAKDLLREVARRFEVVGADFVEVSPPYDPSGITALLAARTSLDFIGSIFHERAKRRRQS